MGQEVKNVRYEQEGKKIIIYYDLVGKVEDSYLVKISYRQENGSPWIGPLKMVTGDVGENVPTGNNKQIVWDVLKDIEKLSGYIQFKVTAEFGKTGFFIDRRDGQKYKWVRIGKQVWMAENLNFKTSSGSWCYNHESLNCKIYGRLYNLITANTACPDGWYLPSKSEWKVLIEYLGGDDIAGGKIKEAGFEHWERPNLGATNNFGFTALPGGYRNESKDFFNLGTNAYFWPSVEINNKQTKIKEPNFYYDDVYRYDKNKNNGRSVRCILDY